MEVQERQPQQADGSFRLTEHSMRVGGAHSPARVGLDIWAVALLARHSNSAIFGYVRDAPLANSISFAKRANEKSSEKQTTQKVLLSGGSQRTCAARFHKLFLLG